MNAEMIRNYFKKILTAKSSSPIYINDESGVLLDPKAQNVVAARAVRKCTLDLLRGRDKEAKLFLDKRESP